MVDASLESIMASDLHANFNRQFLWPDSSASDS